MRDFDLADVALGSFASLPAITARALMSASPPKATVGRRDLELQRWAILRPEHVQQCAWQHASIRPN